MRMIQLVGHDGLPGNIEKAVNEVDTKQESSQQPMALSIVNHWMHQNQIVFEKLLQELVKLQYS